ncbi:MAG: sigma-70 family RNA polymerase sigma factor [Gemmatimonadota bacterium]
MDERTEVTELLRSWADGDRGALDRVVGLTYEELRRVAHHRLRSERADHTLGTTALVNEAYLRLADIRHAGFDDRSHFLAMASRAMRRVLVDHARRLEADKRGGGDRPMPLDDVATPAAGSTADDARLFLSLNDALVRLERRDERQAAVVGLHYFAGLTVVEIADALETSRSTVKRDLRAARAWLADELAPAGNS